MTDMSLELADAPAANSTPAPHIAVAIIGTEGSGKTVLTTVLARRYRTPDAQGIYLEPQDGATLRYVEKVWATLNDGEWPASTAPGELFNLRWKLVYPAGSLACDVRFVDAAGQDLRRLFHDDPADTENLPAHLQTLAQYCRTADIILCLVNLKDLEGESNQERQAENESIILAALNRVSQTPMEPKNRMCLVFTQMDQYREIKERLGGWIEMARAKLPYVYSAHVGTLNVAVTGVSAVNQTRVVDDAQGVRRVPVRDFGSDSFEPLINWVVMKAQAIIAARQEQATAQVQAGSSQRQAVAAHQQSRKRLLAAAVIMFMVLGLGVLVLARGHAARRDVEIDRAVRAGLEGNCFVLPHFLGNDDVWLCNGSSIPMTHVVVTAAVYQDGICITTTILRWPALNGGKDVNWPGVLRITAGRSTRLTVQCDQLRTPFTCP